MDCESCGQHRPSDQVVPARSITGEVVMACGRCRRHLALRPGSGGDFRAPAATAKAAATPV